MRGYDRYFSRRGAASATRKTAQRNSSISSPLRVFAVILPIALGCGGGKPEPRALVPGEECVQCRMTVDRPQYAAQLVDESGEHRVFDHPLCMIYYVVDVEKKTPGFRDAVRAYFVADVNTGKWLDATEARYVVHPSIPTVMDYGVVASDSVSAREMAAPIGARIMSFDELWATYGHERPRG